MWGRNTKTTNLCNVIISNQVVLMSTSLPPPPSANTLYRRHYINVNVNMFGKIALKLQHIIAGEITYRKYDYREGSRMTNVFENINTCYSRQDRDTWSIFCHETSRVSLQLMSGEICALSLSLSLHTHTHTHTPSVRPSISLYVCLPACVSLRKKGES